MNLKRVKLIGVELEGGWRHPEGKALDDDPFPDVVVHNDVSVFRDGEIPEDLDRNRDHYGEIASPTGLAYDDAVAFLKRYYPDFHNDTCGLHYHISVNSNLDYSRLATKKFFNYFLEAAEAWGKEIGLPDNHPFWPRLFGQNRFCWRKFQPSVQMYAASKRGDREDPRRTVINYPYTMHGTVEFRLFPMFEHFEQAKGALDLVVGSVERWLPAQAKERALSSVIRVGDLKEIEKIRQVFKIPA